MKSLLRWSWLTLFLTVGLQATQVEDYKKAKMVADLGIIKHTFEVGYAPLEWKKEYNGWDLDQVYERYKQRILETPAINTKKFQKIVKEFLSSTSDYHVGVHFCSTEEATLPFSVKSVDGRYFINWIDVLKVPPSHYPFRIGDEIIAFDDVLIADIINEIRPQSSFLANNLTDDTLAAIKLTHRAGRAGDHVPSGTVIITGISAKSYKDYSCQLLWNYHAEHVIDPFEMVEGIQALAFLNHDPNSQIKRTIHVMMSSPMQEYIADKQGGHDGGLGARQSFVPPLGTKLWCNEKTSSSNSSHSSSHEGDEGGCGCEDEGHSFWYAYTYQHPNGQPIGYIRIPHYLGSKRQVREFEEIIKYMEEHTDALVIDQVNNFGGSVEFLYQVASHLSPYPLITPQHRIKISPEQVLESYKILEELKFLDILFDQMDGKVDRMTEHEIEEFYNHFNYQYLIFTKKYCEFILSEWKAKHFLTAPTAIVGVDMINPSVKHTYSKPILMLINELDFSGADFLPAILQDNKRATLFGAGTAGAGGYVLGFQFPNNHGIDYFSYTASIAERVNLQKIENLGVTPDIPYQVTVEDVQHQYQGYVKAVNHSVELVLEQ